MDDTERRRPDYYREKAAEIRQVAWRAGSLEVIRDLLEPPIALSAWQPLSRNALGRLLIRSVEPNPAQMARLYGPETPVPDWRERLICSHLQEPRR